ncbi:MAG: DoxX family protein [Actinomycetes bacterium]
MSEGVADLTEAPRGFAGGNAQRWLSTVARLALGGVLFFASYQKILEPTQAAQAVQAYQILPPQTAELVGYGLPLIELGLAVMVLLGFGTRIAGWLSAILMSVFIAGVISVWVRGLSIDCGCFGGGGAVPKGEANYLPIVLRDTLFLGLAVWLAAFPSSRFALDRSGRAGTGDLGLYDELDEPDPDAVDDELSHAADQIERRTITHEEPHE